MKTLENQPIDDVPVSLGYSTDISYCTVRGKHAQNEDYVLFDDELGMCVADGIGGAPLGDAIARYACHIAMEVLKKHGTPAEAVEESGRRISQFLTTVDSPRSGTSLIVARIDRNALKVAWAGNTAIFAVLRTNKESNSASNAYDTSGLICKPLDGFCQEKPSTVSLPLDDIMAFALCTDGAWKAAGAETIGKLLTEERSARETAAKIVFGFQTDDDSTALIAKVRKVDENRQH